MFFQLNAANLGKTKPTLSNKLFLRNGATADPTWVWSGDVLMDLNRYQALKMTPKTLAGVDYLFIEAGGFSTRNKPDWKSQLIVMKRN